MSWFKGIPDEIDILVIALIIVILMWGVTLIW